jgi:hypothetical protein
VRYNRYGLPNSENFDSISDGIFPGSAAGLARRQEKKPPVETLSSLSDNGTRWKSSQNTESPPRIMATEHHGEVTGKPAGGL